jgi:hypothetical protein
LVQEKEGQFDFVFIDGWHTFDHTLIDCFYATRLLRVGGILVIDDVSFPAIKRVVDFFKTYPCYEEYRSVGVILPKTWRRDFLRFLMSPIKRETWANILSQKLYQRIFEDRGNRMVALRKIKEDERTWNWHNGAF